MFLLQPPQATSGVERLYEDLWKEDPKTLYMEIRLQTWILPETWILIDIRVATHRDQEWDQHHI